MDDGGPAAAAPVAPIPSRAVERLPLEYVLPLRRHDRAGETALLRYLARLVRRVEVTVVDGSDAALFASLDARLPSDVRHVRPTVPGLNGKACGALTGVRLSRHDAVIIADDDVRYGDRSLEAVYGLLEGADFVRLQNRYSAHPWFARWDTARELVGRAFGGDYGGTVAVRASALERAGGYSTDVLVENLELERTLRWSGGRVVVARDVLVPRVPPTSSGNGCGRRTTTSPSPLASRSSSRSSLSPSALSRRTRGACF